MGKGEVGDVSVILIKVHVGMFKEATQSSQEIPMAKGGAFRRAGCSACVRECIYIFFIDWKGLTVYLLEFLSLFDQV